MLNEKEAYQKGILDCQRRKYPLYAVLLAAGNYTLADAYHRGWKETSGVDLDKMWEVAGGQAPKGFNPFTTT